MGEEEMEREQTTIRLPPELKEELVREAAGRGIGFNALVLLIIQEHLGNQ